MTILEIILTMELHLAFVVSVHVENRTPSFHLNSSPTEITSIWNLYK